MKTEKNAKIGTICNQDGRDYATVYVRKRMTRKDWREVQETDERHDIWDQTKVISESEVADMESADDFRSFN